MNRALRAFAHACPVVALFAAVAPVAATPVEFPATEIRAVLRHGPWPASAAPDASNRVAASPDAAALGEALFFDPRLSVNGRHACASCHRPERAWTDGERRAQGIARLDRNTLPVWNQALNRWFGWDGGADSLWAHGLRPILDRREMGASAAHVARVLRRSPELACGYARAFGAPPGARDDERVLVDVAKALAAFQLRIVTGRTPFDAFRDALERGDRDAMAAYPAAAQRGLQLFVGRGQCSVCHFGANFSNGEFHDIGMPYFVERGRVDPGRHLGLRLLAASRYTRAGEFSDDPERHAVAARHVALEHRNWGEFRTPSLRNVARTAPYMHDGRLATLAEVVRHYSELDEERLHADGERILRPLRLTPDEAADLVAFLDSLTSDDPPFVRTPFSCVPDRPPERRADRGSARRP